MLWGTCRQALAGIVAQGQGAAFAQCSPERVVRDDLPEEKGASSDPKAGKAVFQEGRWAGRRNLNMACCG